MFKLYQLKVKMNKSKFYAEMFSLNQDVSRLSYTIPIAFKGNCIFYIHQNKWNLSQGKSLIE